jgi:hypothetical protein
MPLFCATYKTLPNTLLSILLYDYEQAVESISQVEKDVGQSKRFTKVEEKTSRLNNQSYLISMKAHKTSAVSSF